MSDPRPVTCQNCNWQATVAACEPIAPRYLPERVAAGDIMPAGECPECGGNALLDPAASQPRARIVPVTNPEHATHFMRPSRAQSLAHVMATLTHACTYRVQDLDRHGCRVAVYKPHPHPGMYPQSYLRIETD